MDKPRYGVCYFPLPREDFASDKKWLEHIQQLQEAAKQRKEEMDKLAAEGKDPTGGSDVEWDKWTFEPQVLDREPAVVKRKCLPKSAKSE